MSGVYYMFSLNGKVSMEFEDYVWCVAPINIIDNMKASSSCLDLLQHLLFV